MSIASNFPSIKPSLNFDFANVGRLDPRVTFARASSGTYYDGVTTAKAEENLLLQSQTFDTTWATSNATVTADTQSAPDGTTTADTITDTVSSTSHRIQQDLSIAANTAYVFSCWLKAGTSNYASLVITDTGTSQRYFAADFDLSTGAVRTSGAGTSGTLTSSSITEFPSGSGWYRCVIIGECAAVSSNTRAIIAVSDGTTALNTFGLISYVGTGTTVYAWGAQLEQRSAVTAYTPTTTQPITNYIPVLQTAASGVARFDHNPTTGEALGLLIEEQRTNLVTYSEDFANAAWTKSQSSITSNTIVAPDGTLTGDLLVNDTTSNAHFTSQSFSKTAQSYTASIFIKKQNYRYVDLGFSGVANWDGLPQAKFDLEDGAVENAGTSATATIKDIGNGWYYCTLTCTSLNTTASSITIAFSDEAVTKFPTFSGNDYSGGFIWGAQLEEGDFPTSYIATTSASATRNADDASMTGTNFSDWYRADEGTLYAEMSLLASDITNSSQRIVTIHDGVPTQNSIRPYITTNETLSLFVEKNGSTSSLAANNTIANTTTPFKTAVAFAYEDAAVCLNGGTVNTSSSIYYPTEVNQMDIGIFASQYTSGYFKKLVYYPKRLTNAELQTLTG